MKFMLLILHFLGCSKIVDLIFFSIKKDDQGRFHSCRLYLLSYWQHSLYLMILMINIITPNLRTMHPMCLLWKLITLDSARKLNQLSIIKEQLLVHKK